jgi:hypothetical protein
MFTPSQIKNIEKIISTIDNGKTIETIVEYPDKDPTSTCVASKGVRDLNDGTHCVFRETRVVIGDGKIETAVRCRTKEGKWISSINCEHQFYKNCIQEKKEDPIELDIVSDEKTLNNELTRVQLHIGSLLLEEEKLLADIARIKVNKKIESMMSEMKDSKSLNEFLTTLNSL